MTGRHLSPAGWVWMAYAVGVVAIVTACSGCATPPPAPALAPAAGLRCWLGADQYLVGGELRTAPGWWGVRHLASNGQAGEWFASSRQLTRCTA